MDSEISGIRLGSIRRPRSGQKSKQLIIFLHGYASNGESLIHLADRWAEFLPDAEFIAPNGLEPHEYLADGYRWFRWIDFENHNVRPNLEAAGIVVARTLRQWLEQRALRNQDFALVGFSQGTMLALELLFHFPGIQSIIGYAGAFYPNPNQQPLTQKSNVLLVHGDKDEGVPYSALLDAQSKLNQLDIYPSILTCNGTGHHIDDEGVRAGGQFLRDAFYRETC